MNTKNQRPQSGFLMPVLLFTIAFIVTLIAFIGSFTLTTYNLSSRETYRVGAQLAADAGLDASLIAMNTDPSWTGTGATEVEIMNDGKIRTAYTATLSSGVSSDRKILSVTAKTYSPATDTNAKITRKYEVDVQAVTSGSLVTSVVSGVGGLILSNNAKITGGDVVVNGTITLGNNSQIGLSTTPAASAVNVRVAHTNCPSPANSTYPRVCGPSENGQPITLGNNSKIYADVRATNQTTGTNMSNPGLIPNQVVAPYTLPDYDRDAQKAAITATYASNSSTISCGNNQTKNWPANIRITGNVSLGNNCTVNVSGDVWLSGNLSFGNNAKIVISSSVGTDRPTIMVDGSSGIVFGNNNEVRPNSSGTGAFFITYWSSASCSPDCADVTGTDLKNSQGVTTINLSNNTNAANTVLYSRWSKVKVSNNGALGAVAGQTIELGNNAVINFTASVPGSDNLTQTWVKRGYMRVFD